MSKRVPSFAFARKPLPLAYAYEYDLNDEDESNPAAFSNVKVNIFPLDQIIIIFQNCSTFEK